MHIYKDYIHTFKNGEKAIFLACAKCGRVKVANSDMPWHECCSGHLEENSPVKMLNMKPYHMKQLSNTL